MEFSAEHYISVLISGQIGFLFLLSGAQLSKCRFNAIYKVVDEF